jgi:hypothetical protein
MIPRQLEEIARQRTQEMRSQARQVSRPARGSARERRNFAAIRKHTGWSLVQIGLRIAASGGH